MTSDAGTTDLVGVRAAALALGLNPSTVSRYLKDHPELNLGNETRPKVDVAALRQHRIENLNAARRGSYAGKLLGEGDALDLAAGREQSDTKPVDVPTYAASRAAREAALAERAQLDLDEKLGTLVVRAEIEEACEKAARLLQLELSELAPRLAEEIAAMGEAREIQVKMEMEYRGLLKRVAAELGGWK